VLNIHHTTEQAIGDNCGISSLKVADSLKIIIAGSSGRLWGLWNMTTLKRLMLIEEESAIIDLEILGASGDRAAWYSKMRFRLQTNLKKKAIENGEKRASPHGNQNFKF
jgi:hypothetical protein